LNKRLKRRKDKQEAQAKEEEELKRREDKKEKDRIRSQEYRDRQKQKKMTSFGTPASTNKINAELQLSIRKMELDHEAAREDKLIGVLKTELRATQMNNNLAFATLQENNNRAYATLKEDNNLAYATFANTVHSAMSAMSAKKHHHTGEQGTPTLPYSSNNENRPPSSPYIHNNATSSTARCLDFGGEAGMSK
jgi:hypothetical protein